MLRLLIIDRYLLRQFVQTFLICFCSLTGLYIVIDGFANLEEFINYGQKDGGLLKVMGEYYALPHAVVLRRHEPHSDADRGHVHRDLDPAAQRADRAGSGRLAQVAHHRP